MPDKKPVDSKAAQKAFLEQRRLEKEAAEAARKKSERTFWLIMTAVVVVLVAGFILGVALVNARADSGDEMRSADAATTANFKMDGAMASYYIYSDFWSMANYYGTYLTYLGLDPTKPLREQDNQTEGVSWFDYFADSAKASMTEVLVLNEAAKAAGVTLTDADKDAAAHRTAFADDYTPFGRGVKPEDVRRITELKIIATRFAYDTMNAVDISLPVIEAKYNELPAAYQTCAYRSYELGYADGNANGLTADTAKAAADELAAAADEAAFTAWVESFIREHDNTEEGITDEQLTTALDATLHSKYAYDAASELSEWCFNTAAVGDTRIETDETNSKYTVYMLTSEPARDETESVDARHILFTATNYGTDEDALAAAESALAEFNAAGATEEAFAALAVKYSEDEGTAYRGGMLDNIAAGTTVSEFNDWIFDSARANGDVDIVKSSYGYHVIYFLGDGLSGWQAAVASDIVTADYNAKYTAWTEAYPVTINAAAFDLIPDKVQQSTGD